MTSLRFLPVAVALALAATGCGSDTANTPGVAGMNSVAGTPTGGGGAGATVGGAGQSGSGGTAAGAGGSMSGAGGALGGAGGGGGGGSAGMGGALLEPTLLSQTGLFKDIKAQTKELAAGVYKFTPAYALWSDGATKQRYVYMPPGGKIDTTDMDFWQYPAGFKLWKDFTRDGKLIETRLLLKKSDGATDWYMVAFVWNDDYTEATATPMGQMNARGTMHDVPPKEGCVGCHQSMHDNALGFSAMQLSHSLPDSLNLTQIATMGWLTTTGLALWSASATNFLLQYGFGLALVTAFSLYQRFRDSEVRIAAIEKAWTAARLAALRMQLSPHTLFNLLHVIRGQVAWDPRTAQSMIVQLADLLRRLLAAGEQDFSRLREELQFVRLYLQLQQQRFIDRLTVELPAEEQLPEVWIPSLILQPLAENAVVHGLARHDGHVGIRVEALIDDDALVLRVRNDMAPASPLAPAGIGVANVRERLAVHFNGAAQFRSEPDGRSDWTAEIRIPVLRTRPSGAAS